MTDRQTKRRYAHELYPHADEWTTRPLKIDVPYLYAQAIGHEVFGTSWFRMETPEERELAVARTLALIRVRTIAFLADALAQGMRHDEAWQWAMERANEESGEWVYERAEFYGVDPDQIKPYPCGPEPDSHDHHGPADSRGFRTVTRAEGKESECEACTEPVPVPQAPLAMFDEGAPATLGSPEFQAELTSFFTELSDEVGGKESPPDAVVQGG